MGRDGKDAQATESGQSGRRKEELLLLKGYRGRRFEYEVAMELSTSDARERGGGRVREDVCDSGSVCSVCLCGQHFGAGLLSCHIRFEVH